MLHHATFLTALACMSVSAQAAGGFVPRSFDSKSDQDLGVMPSLEAFFEALGTNSSDWVALPNDAEEETLNDVILESNMSPNNNRQSKSIAPRVEDMCADFTRWERIICYNMPYNWVFWTSGAALLIYYTPSIFNRWMDSLSIAVVEGVNFNRRYARQRNQEGPTRRKDTTDGDAGVIFFKLEQPLSGGLQSRHIDEDGAQYDLHVYDNWAYDTKTGILEVQGTSGNFGGPGAPEVVEDGVITRRQSTDYNVGITVQRLSSARTTASPACVASVLLEFTKRTSENHRHTCQPMHNQGSWRAAVGIDINDGRWNTYRPNNCCF